MVFLKCHTFSIFKILNISVLTMVIVYELRRYNTSDTRPTKKKMIADNHSTVLDDDSYYLFEHNYTNLSGADVSRVKLKFLPQFKNPCWVEQFTGENVYRRNGFYSQENVKPYLNFGEKLKQLHPTGVSVKLTGKCEQKSCRLRCLPYFMLIGVAKSGTTDISNRMVLHPQIFGSLQKELFWWTQFRYIMNTTLSDYSDLFDRTLQMLLQQSRNGKYRNIMGEFTSMTFYDFAHWREDPVNKNLLEPQKTLVHDIHSVLPNVKLIVIMRNPTSRLYSQYNMYNSKVGTPQDFHKRVLGSILWWETCVRKLPERNCIYGSPPGMPHVYDNIGDKTQWWPREKNYSAEIRYGMYSLFIEDWLAVFPRSNFLFLKTEQYGVDIAKSYNEEIFPFLDVDKLTEGPKLDRLTFKKVSNKKSYEPMLEKTKLILDVFYQPFNQRLAAILKDDKWLWKESHEK